MQAKYYFAPKKISKPPNLQYGGLEIWRFGRNQIARM